LEQLTDGLEVQYVIRRHYGHEQSPAIHQHHGTSQTPKRKVAGLGGLQQGPGLRMVQNVVRSLIPF
jgi:hypothetical protein